MVVTALHHPAGDLKKYSSGTAVGYVNVDNIKNDDDIDNKKLKLESTVTKSKTQKYSSLNDFLNFKMILGWGSNEYEQIGTYTDVTHVEEQLQSTGKNILLTPHPPQLLSNDQNVNVKQGASSDRASLPADL